ncbi:MAG: prolyl oligopeptidase family serine peptidase [Thermoplasmata archaeon]
MGEDPPSAALTQRLRRWLDHPTSRDPAAWFDGSLIAFISDRSGLPQVWTSGLHGGQPLVLHPTSERVGRVQPSPFGPRAIVATDVGGDERWALTLWTASSSGSGIEARSLTSETSRIHQPGAWRDDHHYVFTANLRDVRFFDVYDLNVDAGAPASPIVQEDALLVVPDARGERLVVLRHRTNLDCDLLLWDRGRVHPLNPHDGEETIFDATLGKDAVYAAANPDRELTAVVRYRTGASPETLQGFPGDVEMVRSDSAGTRLFVSVNDRGWSRVYVYDLERSTLLPFPTLPNGVTDGASWLPGGHRFVVGVSASRLGHELYLVDTLTSTARPITSSPVPLPARSPEPVLRQFVAVDELEIPYWVHSPSAASRGTLVLVHGGPEAQARPRFDPMVEFLVAEGYTVVEPNVRGSLGYGRRYVHLDDVRQRMDPVRDVRDLVHALRRSGIPGTATPSHLGIIGGSYGGFMVLSTLTTYPELFHAAVDIVGIANFVTFLERTAPWRRKVREAEYGSLEHDREFLESISPIHQVDRIQAPLLVVHGENDPRVPVSEAEQIVKALEARNVPVEFLRFGDEGHGLVRRENQIVALTHAAKFFDRYVG